MLHCVNRGSFQALRVQLQLLSRRLLRRRGVVLRALFSWAIGCLALTADETSSYDRRFNLRGDQAVRSDVILITLRPSDFIRPFDVRTKSLAQLNEITDLTDSLFWDRHIWYRLLGAILRDKPASVGVTLWFGDNIRPFQMTEPEAMVFQDPRVIWSTSLNNLEQLLRPRFALDNLANIGSHDLKRDEDGLIRRVLPTPYDLPHLAERMTRVPFTDTTAGLVINYRASPKRGFEHYSLSEVIYGRLPAETFRGKYVLIGAESQSGAPSFLTPLGPMDRAEIIAQILDNHLGDRWIQRLPFGTYALMLLLLTILAVFLITTYPQSVALLFFLWIGTLCAALSAWAFDSFAIWFPAFSPFVLLSTTWVIFIGYQAMTVEKMHAKLQQEQRYLRELEQLKNNFVSLISHDLKTPIAKIQAIIGRLRNTNVAPEIDADLRSLHDSSEELNRYIQSILKVLRVESRDFKLHLEVADINEVIEAAVQQLRPLAQHKNINLNSQLEPLFSLEFDVTLIREVVINLIENGIKYTPSGGLIEIKSRETEDSVEVTVSDTGQGIAPQDMELVWRKFARGTNEEHRTKGTGLGLYLVKYFIELHGGSVAMESTLGKGSTVSFRLPLESKSS